MRKEKRTLARVSFFGIGIGIGISIGHWPFAINLSPFTFHLSKAYIAMPAGG